jgi:hypothetical protein
MRCKAKFDRHKIDPCSAPLFPQYCAVGFSAQKGWTQISLKSDKPYVTETCDNLKLKPDFMYKLRIEELGGHLLALSKKELEVKGTWG